MKGWHCGEALVKSTVIHSDKRKETRNPVPCCDLVAFSSSVSSDYEADLAMATLPHSTWFSMKGATPVSTDRIFSSG